MTIIISDKCTGCGRCVAACTQGAISLATQRPDGFGCKQAVIDSCRCRSCLDCLPTCLYQAIKA